VTPLPLVLDLFSGTGSATQPFVECGKHRVVRVDWDRELRPDLLADVRDLPLECRPDFIWGSPPCQDFTRYAMPWMKTRSGSATIFPGIPQLDFVWAFYRQVRRLRPRLWAMENVQFAQRWIGRAPFHWGPYYLWGWYPPLKIHGDLPEGGKMRHWARTKEAIRQRGAIPRPLAEAVHRAVCQKRDRQEGSR